MESGTINIGKRLRELRLTCGLSQGDIENRTGLTRPYISRIENGNIVPSLDTLEKVAKALGLELYQLFFTGPGNPTAPRMKPEFTRIAPEGRPTLGEIRLARIFRQLNRTDRRLLLSLARNMVVMAQRPKRNGD